MKYIDKTINKQEGEQIVGEFLSCFHNRRGTYPNDMYDAFSKEIDDAHNHVIFRQRLISEVLIPEQGNRCCYCLRDLSQCAKITVEHIMPNHAQDKAELDTYRTRQTELDGLPHPNDYRREDDFIATPPHPHSIAYQNLVLSCHGDFFNENSKPMCCNLKREHRFMPPIVLFPDIQLRFEYCEDGTASWSDDPEPPESKKNVVRILGLNNSILKMIRRMWFFCNDNDIDLHQKERGEIVNLMFSQLAKSHASERETNMLLNFKKDKYWNLLLQYDAFAEMRHA